MALLHSSTQTPIHEEESGLVGESLTITVPFGCTGRLGDPRTRKTPERLPPIGPSPASTSEVPRTRYAIPGSRGETV